MSIINLITFLAIILKGTSIDILKNDFNASVVGMGGSKAIVEEGINSLNYNPAGIGFNEKFEALLSIYNGFEDASYSYIGTSFKIPTKLLSEIDNPALGISAYFSNLGDMKLRTVDNFGNVTEKNVNAEKDTIITLGYAEKLTKQNIFIKSSKKSKFESTAGISFKYIKSTLLSKYYANTFTSDIGYMGKLSDIGIKFGISLSNSFGKIKYYKEEYKLPNILRLGFSYSRNIIDKETIISIQYDNYTTDKKQSLKFGIDHTIKETFSLRLGYKLIEDNNGLSIGLGFYTKNISFDIATTFTKVYKYSILSLTYKVAGIEDINSKKNKSQQLERFKEKNTDNKTSPTTPSKEKLIIVF